MKRRPLVFLAFLVLLLAGAAGFWVARGVRRAEPPPTAPSVGAPKARFPKPELPPGYTYPATPDPASRATVEQWTATAILVAALVLAAWLGLVKRSRRGLFLLAVFSVAYFGFVRGGCVCPIGAIQHVTAALFDGGFVLPAGVLLFFVLPLAAALFFGRVFCSSVCPLGATQDIVLLWPLRVPRWLELGLGLFAHAYLGLAVLFAATGAGFIICRYDPFVGFFRLSGRVEMLVAGACVVLIALFIGRPYCRFLCPYGVLLRILSKLSAWHVTTTPDDCIECGMCEDACPFGALRKPTAYRPEHRSEGKGWLAVMLLALPVLVASGVWLGREAGPALAAAHPTVIRAREVRRAEGQTAAPETDIVRAFRKTIRTGEETTALYTQEAGILRRFRTGGGIFGAWMGLVIGARLVALSVRRRRDHYEPERGPCVACGRCFRRCPREHLRLRRLREEAT